MQQKTEIKQKSEEVRRSQKKSEEVRSEVFILCGVVTVTFRVLSLFVVTKCYSYSKIVLQLIVVPPGEYPINRLI
jgi:nitrate reductase NapE component